MAFLQKLSEFISKCIEDPTVLSDPSLRFFRDYIERVGGELPDVKADEINPWWAQFTNSSLLCPVTGEVILDPVYLPIGDETKYLTYFKEESFIGHGGFGFVVKVKNLLDNQVYAVKKIPLKYAAKRFDKVLREVIAISSLKHQHIVRYYQAWVERQLSGVYCNEGEEIDECGDDILTAEEREGPCLYVLMEFCPRTLSQSIKDSTREKSLEAFRQILSAVACINDRGFVHGDLSIGNIFMDESDNVKVGDLGQSRKIDEKGYVFMSDDDGNTHYKPPESEIGAMLDSKADMYSLGLILGELLHPFETETERLTTLKGFKEGMFPTRWNDVDGSTIRELTSLIPDDRPTAAVLLEKFERTFFNADEPDNDSSTCHNMPDDRPTAAVLLEKFERTFSNADYP